MKRKNNIQPHSRRLGKLKNGNPPCDLWSLPKCNAKAKSTGKRCQQPAMKNGKCRYHGGKSTGAPLNNQNAFKHGNYTQEAIEMRRAIQQLMQESKRFIEEIK